MADFARGDSVFVNGQLGTIVQADRMKAVVRLNDGSSVPAMIRDLSPGGGPSPSRPPPVPGPSPADLLEPESPPPLRTPTPTPAPARPMGPLLQLRDDCLKWTIVDGFGFHRLFRSAVDLNLLQPAELGEQYGVSVSMVRNWTTGDARPPPKVQRELIVRIIQKAELGAVGQLDEAPSPYEDAGPNPDQKPPSSSFSSSEVLAQGTKLIEVQGRSLTLELTQEEPNKWTAICVEIPTLSVSAETEVEAVLDVKALAVNHIAKQTQTAKKSPPTNTVVEEHNGESGTDAEQDPDG